MAAVAAKSKRENKPLYLRVERLVRPETGEIIGALVPSTRWDQQAMRERKLKVGSEVRGLFKRKRNRKLHNLGHALCAFIAERVPGFEDEDGHKALKRLQRECGAYCEEQELDLGPMIGKVMVKVARSIAFDEMEEHEFQDLLKQISRHIAEKYLTTMTAEEVEAAVEMMVQE